MTAAASRSRADGEPIRVAGRDQLLVVGEFSLDQTGGDLRRPDPEENLSLAEDDLDLAAAREQPLHLTETLRGHQDPLALLQHAHAGEVAECESVGIGGNETQTVRRRGEEHPGQDGPGVVARRCRNHLAQSGREPFGVDADSRVLHLGEARELRSGQRAQRRREPPGFDVGVVVNQLDGDGVTLQLLHDLGQEASRDHHAALAVSLDRHPNPDRQLEIGADDLQFRSGDGDPQTRQHGHRPRPSRYCAVRSRDGVGEVFALTAELHSLLLTDRSQ